MIQVSHLVKYYGDFLAGNDLSFTIEDGHVYGFLGPNGAGKSTTMNIMTGCLSPTDGSVKIGGFDILEQPEQAKRLIGYLPEQPPLYSNETPLEYGLDDPICTIHITAGDETYTVKLGDFSKMDEQRYISLDDGNAYLVSHDPLDEFGAVLKDMILDDTVPEFDLVSQLSFSGTENYTITRNEDGTSICQDDIYFADGNPLDTDLVDNYIQTLTSLSLSDYVSYNVTEDELETFGLDSPELTLTLDYATTNEDGETESEGTFILNLSRNPEEFAAYEEALGNSDDTDSDEELPSVTCYARVGDSQIVYEISQTDFDALTAVSYDTLRHQKLFTADFDTITSIDISLEGSDYTFVCIPADDDEEGTASTWTYQDAEISISDLRTALQALTADSFTDKAATGQQEISLIIHLDNEDFPTLTLTLSRYDGDNCLAAVDGTSVAFVARSQVVSLVESINKIVLAN